MLTTLKSSPSILASQFLQHMKDFVSYTTNILNSISINNIPKIYNKTPPILRPWPNFSIHVGMSLQKVGKPAPSAVIRCQATGILYQTIPIG